MQTTAVAVPVRDTGDALKASLTGALNTLFAAIPRILGFVVVLIIGWIISSLLARGVQALLHAVRFNDLARRAGLADFVHKMGVKDDSSAVLAGIVKWFVRLITLVVAFDTLGLPAVSNVLQQLLRQQEQAERANDADDIGDGDESHARPFHLAGEAMRPELGVIPDQVLDQRGEDGDEDEHPCI